MEMAAGLLASTCGQHKAWPLYAGCCSQRLPKPPGAVLLLRWWHQEELLSSLGPQSCSLMGCPQHSSRCRTPGPEPLLTSGQYEAQPLQTNRCSVASLEAAVALLISGTRQARNTKGCSPPPRTPLSHGSRAHPLAAPGTGAA